jgi:hypothetical protein
MGGEIGGDIGGFTPMARLGEKVQTAIDHFHRTGSKRVAERFGS